MDKCKVLPCSDFVDFLLFEHYSLCYFLFFACLCVLPFLPFASQALADRQYAAEQHPSSPVYKHILEMILFGDMCKAHKFN